MSAARRPLELDDETTERIFKKRVLPAYLRAGLEPLADPKLVVVGGQMGSGKSTAIARLDQDRDVARSRVTIVPDELLAFIPGYEAAARADSVKAQREVGATPQWWLLWLYEHALEARADIIFEVAGGDMQTLRRIGQKARDAGYQTELRVVATHELESWYGVVSRFHRALVDGEEIPRYVERESHEIAYDRWPGSLAALDSKEVLFDRIEVHSRSVVQTVWTVGEPPRTCEDLLLVRAASLNRDRLKAIARGWEVLVQSQELGNSLPEMFLSDQRAVEEALADPAVTTHFRPGGGHGEEFVERWVGQVHRAANNALGEALSDWFADRIKSFKAAVVEQGKAFVATEEGDVKPSFKPPGFDLS